MRGGGKVYINHRNMPSEMRENLVKKVNDGFLIPVIELHVHETQDCFGRTSDEREELLQETYSGGDQPQREITQSIMNRSEKVMIKIT